MKRVLCAIALSVVAVLPAHAADCRLIPRAVLEFQNTPAGDLTIPVTISGKTYQFTVALEDTYSAFNSKLADELHLARKDMPDAIKMHIGGDLVSHRVVLPDIQIGGAHGKDIEMLELPPQNADATAGFIGLDLLSVFDLELDMKANTMRLFSQDHCPGAGVYWATTYGSMPIERTPDGGVYLDGRLDDKKVSISFSVQESDGTMGMADARDLFGFAKNDSRLTPVDAERARYPFGKLALGDLTIERPKISLYPQTPAQQCRVAPKHPLPHDPELFPSYYGPVCLGATSLTLGRDVMKQLRLYFAFKEGTLYLTPANASAAK